MPAKRFGKPRRSGEPSGSTERKIRILLELIRNKYVRLSALCSQYGASERSMLRDFQELRKIGARAGFTLADKVVNDRLELQSFDSRPTALDRSGKALYALIRSAAAALGKPVEEELGEIASQERSDRRFMRFMMPTLIEGTRVTHVYKALERAWAADARVRFRYGEKGERTVEPYAVLQRSGRYFLLARDVAAKDHGWRHFALDQIIEPIGRAGTFTPRDIPPEYRSYDVLGWMRGGPTTSVSVWLSPHMAPSATSRQWQHDQDVEHHADGSATMTFAVGDVDEVIRWTFGFGAEARVVAPEAAVKRAQALARSICDAYARS
jgi:predicted DNA-binding transcriptional regulator YafY